MYREERVPLWAHLLFGALTLLWGLAMAAFLVGIPFTLLYWVFAGADPFRLWPWLVFLGGSGLSWGMASLIGDPVMRYYGYSGL